MQELGERKIALFLLHSDSDKSLNYLVGMIYTQLIQTLYRQADRMERTLACAGALLDGHIREHFLAERHLFVGTGPCVFAPFLLIIVQNMAQLMTNYQGRLGIAGRSVR